MAKATKVDGRTARSHRTRARVVQAATQLFVDRGYLATTIEDVAAEAGVAVQTVYYLFGTKAKLLSGVLDASIVGDVEPVPVLDRPWVDELRQERDPVAAMERLVAETVGIVARASPVYEVIRTAAAHPEVGALLEENHRTRRVGQGALVEILHRSVHLAPELDLDTAADVFYGILNEDVFHLLVGVRGWSVDRFRGWMTSVLLQQLVRGDALAGQATMEA